MGFHVSSQECSTTILESCSAPALFSAGVAVPPCFPLVITGLIRGTLKAALRHVTVHLSPPALKLRFPKIRGTFLGVPRIRIIVYWGLYWSPLI